MANGAVPAQTTAPDLSRLRIERGGAARPRRRSGVFALLLLAVLGFVGWAYATGRLDLSPDASVVEVETTVVLASDRAGAGPARNAPIAGDVVGNGYVIARRRAALSTVLSGRLVELHVEEGTRVKAGEVVARIQHDDYDAALAQAKNETLVATRKKGEIEKSLAASRLDLDRLRADNKVLDDLVTQAKAEADHATADFERNRGLVEEHVVSQAQGDQYAAAKRTADAALLAAQSKVAAGRSAETAWSGEIARREAMLATAGAEVARAEESERLAEIVIEKTYVRAPFDGLVVHKDAELGEVVAATGAGGNSRGSVATIVDPETLEVQVELSETRLGAIAEGDPVSIALDAAPRKAFRGRVRQVWPTADRQKATVEIRVVFVDRPPVVRPEMGARVSFVSSEAAKDASKSAGDGASSPPRVDAAAVVEENGKKFVYVVAGGVVHRVEASVGSPVDGLAPVLSGLSGGETVVLRPSTGLRDGERVKTKRSKP